MKILVDAHMVGSGETGNETYMRGLIRGLASLRTADEFLLAVVDPAAPGLDVSAHGGRFRLVPVSASPLRRLLVDLPRLVRTHRPDLLHVTYASPPRVSCPVVATIHDVSYRRHPEWFSPRDRLVLRLGVGLSARTARRLITVSEFSRREILRFYPRPATEVSVTLEAAAPGLADAPATAGGDEDLRRLGVRPPYILAVGNLQPRKNLLRAMEAFALLRRSRGLTHQLVLAGPPHHRAQETVRAVADLGLTGAVCLTGYVTDATLGALYQRADLFCYPTLYEGFGLPVLEAMACGTAVVASNAASIPEVAGDAARLVDPLDVRAIADGLAQVLEDHRYREDLVRRGRARAAGFSWEQTAAQTLEAYRLSLSALPGTEAAACA